MIMMMMMIAMNYGNEISNLKLAFSICEEKIACQRKIVRDI